MYCECKLSACVPPQDRATQRMHKCSLSCADAVCSIKPVCSDRRFSWPGNEPALKNMGIRVRQLKAFLCISPWRQLARCGTTPCQCHVMSRLSVHDTHYCDKTGIHEVTTHTMMQWGRKELPMSSRYRVVLIMSLLARTW